MRQLPPAGAPRDILIVARREISMSVLWITKRHYTHKDALAERYGRVYELPATRGTRWSR